MRSLYFENILIKETVQASSYTKVYERNIIKFYNINVPWLTFEFDDLKLRCTFQAITKKLNDPLISQGSTRLEEDRTVVRCVTGDTLSDKEIEEMRLPPAPLVPLGRHGTECNTWLRMQLHDIDSGVRKRSGLVVKINLKQLIITL